MRLRGWQIDGWGHFRDYAQEELVDGLNIFLGFNEAGKSTQLAFIRQILFGFPHHRRNVPKYEPLRGGVHGGTLLLGNGGEVFEIRRTYDSTAMKEGEVTLPDGRLGTHHDLDRVLMGADGTLFENVFAFSLTELQDLESLHQEEIKDRLFSSGISGAGASARTVIKALEDRQDALMRNRSTDGEVNALLVQIEGIRSELSQARAEAKRYGTLLDRHAELSSGLDGYDSARLAREAERARYELLLDLWKDEAERQRLHRELGELPPVDTFPERGPERLVACQTKLEQAEKELTEARDRHQGLETRRAQLEAQCDDALFERRMTLRAALEGLGTRRSDGERVPELRRDLETHEEKLGRCLRTLGPQWGEQAVQGLDLSRQARQRVEDFAEVRVRQEAERDRCTRDLEERRRDVAETGKRLADLEGGSGGGDATETAKDNGKTEARVAALDRMETALTELRRHESRMEAARQNVEIIRTTQAPGDEDTRQPSAYLPLVLGLLGLGLIGVGMAIAGDGGMVPTLILMLSGFAAMVVASSLHMKRKAAEQGQALRQRARDAVKRAESNLSDLEGKAEALEAAVKEAAVEGGLTPEAREVELRRARTTLAEARATRLATSRHSEKIAGLREELERQQEAEEDAIVALEDADAEWKSHVTTWDEWRVAWGLAEERSPKQVIAFMDDAEAALEAIEQRDRIRATHTEFQDKCAAWDAEARVAVEGLVELTSAPTIDDLAGVLRDLERRLEEEGERRKQLAALPAELAAGREAVERKSAALEEAAEALAALLEEAGASDVDDFEMRRQHHRERLELTGKLRAIDDRLEERLGLGEEAEATRAQLESGEVQEWTERVRELDEELERLRQENVERIEERTKLRVELDQMEASCDIAARELRIESLATDLEAALRRWTVLGLARNLVETTLKTYVHDKQPKVLRYATEIFETVTDGRYTQIVQTEEEDGVEVIESTGRRKSPDQLSRGTVEQLYLALRLGFAMHFGQEVVELPIVMDDVLVNFDPVRAAAMARAIAQVAQSHQVLFFTCHPHLVEMLQAADSACNLIELESGVEAALA